MVSIENILVGHVYEAINNQMDWNEITEIRLRIGKPMIVNSICGESVWHEIIIDEKILKDTFNKITNYSAYAFEDCIRCGFITVAGGHRIGLGGEVVCENGHVITFKNIRFLNIRIAHCIAGCCEDIVNKIICDNGIKNTLIISPPGMGKTTLLKDLIWNLSNKIIGTSISVIDERNEISGSYRGEPTIDLGPRTDVICNCMKSAGIEMAVRSLGPKIIAVDEIGNENDMKALWYAAVSGVNIIATIHGLSISDVDNKLENQWKKIFPNKILIMDKGEYVIVDN